MLEPSKQKNAVTIPAYLNYWLGLPKDYSEACKWPLILFLHGAGERGDDLEKVKVHGVPHEVAAGRDLPFITVSPQCPKNTWWPDHGRMLMAILDEVSAKYAVDPDRIYLTGLSMGGFGSWYLGCCYPERFAAVAPICGGGMWGHGFPDRVVDLAGVPVWAFHGARDPVVPITMTVELVDRLKAVGGDVRLSVFPDAEHDAWTRVYAGDALYEWFLSNSRSNE